MKKSILFFLIIFGFCNKIFSCDCNPTNIDSSYKWADLIVHGKIISEKNIELIQSKQYLDSLSNMYQMILTSPQKVREYQVLVMYNYKNKPVSDTIKIRTYSPSTCSIFLKINFEYIVYANSLEYLSIMYDKKTNSNVFQTGQCSRTEIFDKKEDKYLRAKKKN